MLTSMIVLGHLEHEVRNATTCIKGIIEKAIVNKAVTKQALNEISKQLDRVEKSLDHYVQSLNKGNHDGA